MDSRSSRDPVPQDQAEHPEVVLRSAEAAPANNAADLILRALREVGLRHAPEWVEHPVCRLRECRRNRQGVPALLRADPANAISKAPKRGR